MIILVDKFCSFHLWNLYNLFARDPIHKNDADPGCLTLQVFHTPGTNVSVCHLYVFYVCLYMQVLLCVSVRCVHIFITEKATN